MYKVTTPFIDLQDDNHAYQVGDQYPREGAPAPSEARIEQLATEKNVLSTVFIEPIEEVKDGKDEAVEEVKEEKKTRAKK